MDCNLLRGKMAEKRLSQAKLAKEMGISTQSLCRKINGKRDFKLSEVQDLCRLLEIENPSHIFFT